MGRRQLTLSIILSNKLKALKFVDRWLYFCLAVSYICGHPERQWRRSDEDSNVTFWCGGDDRTRRD